MLTKSEIRRSLYDVQKKLIGLSELFRMARGEFPFSEMGLIGISDIMTELAVEVENVCDEFERIS